MEFPCEGKFKVIVKPNSYKNELFGYKESRKAYKVAICQPADKGKANLELIKFVKKKTGKSCEILSGFASREKLLRLF